MGPVEHKHGVRESFAKVTFLFAKNGRLRIKEFWSTIKYHQLSIAASETGILLRKLTKHNIQRSILMQSPQGSQLAWQCQWEFLLFHHTRLAVPTCSDLPTRWRSGRCAEVDALSVLCLRGGYRIKKLDRNSTTNHLLVGMITRDHPSISWATRTIPLLRLDSQVGTLPFLCPVWFGQGWNGCSTTQKCHEMLIFANGFANDVSGGVRSCFPNENIENKYRL